MSKSNFDAKITYKCPKESKKFVLFSYAMQQKKELGYVMQRRKGEEEQRIENSINRKNFSIFCFGEVLLEAESGN